MRARFAVLTLLLLATTVGCAKRAAPYRFRANLVSSVHAPALNPRPHRSPSARLVAARANPRRAHRTPVAVPHVVTSIPAKPLASQKGPTLADQLRATVGTRDSKSSHTEHALAALAGIGASLDPGVLAADIGKELLDIAKERDATSTDSPLLGDLVVFDNVVGRKDASLIGVVVSTDNRGTVEFVYLARGVVRRGYMNRNHPATKRDDAGRVLNTHVRHNDGKNPRGTRYLAGELFATYIRLDRLLD
jgi:hypothetical protein